MTSPAPPIVKGSRCNVWTDKDINGSLQTSTTGDICRYQRLIVCARNIAGDDILGEGSTSMRKVAVAYGKAVNMVVKMKDKRGKPKGRVEMIMQIDPMAVIPPNSLVTTDVSTIRAYLPNCYANM